MSKERNKKTMTSAEMAREKWLRSQPQGHPLNNSVGYPPPSETRVLYPKPIRNSAIGHPAPIPKKKGEA